MSDNLITSRENLFAFLKQLARVFTYVRLLDVELGKKFIFSDSGKVTVKTAGDDATGPESLTGMALATKAQINKFEFLKNNVYFITAKYMVVDEHEYVLESVSLINNDYLFKDFGKNDFMRLFEVYSEENYRDPLTTCYNRRYYDEQQKILERATSIARIDLDLYKQIKETYSETVAEAALKTVGINLQKSVRKSDSVIYLGENKFIIFFFGMKQNVLKAKLEGIRADIERSIIPQHPGVKLSISIGGYYSERIEIEDLKRAQELLNEAKIFLNRVVVNCDSTVV